MFLRLFSVHRPLAHLSFLPVFVHQYRGMKRKARASPDAAARKSIKVDYCDVQSVKDENDNLVWPAPRSQMKAAGQFLKEW